MNRRPILALLAGLVLLPATAVAQSTWTRQVQDQLDVAGDVLRPDGYTLVGEPHIDTLDDEMSEDFNVTLEAGVKYMLVGVCDNDCPDIDLRLLDSSGSEVDSDYEEDAFPMVEVTPTRTASYQVHVYMADCSTGTCFYGVGVFAQGSAGARPAAGGGPATHNYQGRLEGDDERLDSKEYYDAYDFYGMTGDAVVIDLFSSEFDPYLILLAPSGNDTQNDDYEGSTTHSRIEMTLDETGEWTAVATSYDPGETGAYQLSITTTGIGTAMQQFAGGGTERGSLDAGDDTLSSGEYFDTFHISGDAGEYVVVDLRSRDFDPYLILQTPTREQFENDDHEGDATRSQLAMELPESGSYSIFVTTYKPHEVGNYTLTIERGSAATAFAPRVERGALMAGDDTLSSGEYADAYEIEGRPGQHLRLDVSSSEFDTYLIAMGPGGSQSENDDVEGMPGHSLIEMELTEVGAYTVVVTSYKRGETGSYELTMDFGEAGPTTAPARDVVALGIGDRTSGRLEPGDQQLAETREYADLYVFEGTVGQPVSIRMTSTEFDTYLQLQTPDGEKIDNDDYEGSSDSRIDVTLRRDGRYRVMTTSYKQGETGTYELAIVESSAAEIAIARADPVPPPGEGRIYGVFMGISDYPGEASDLSYTADDAVRVHDAMVRVGMRPQDAVVLIDDQATIGNLHGAVRDFSGRMGPADKFVLFYSGHGNRLPRAAGYDATDPDALDETIELYDGPFTDDEMNRMFDGVNAGVSLIVLDACFSGGFVKDVISAPGRMGLFSSEEDVTSSVAAKFRAGGYLAVFFADALGDGLADADGDGGVSAIELSQYLQERYRADVKSADPGDYVRTGGPQLGYQHLVVDRGSIGPYQVLFELAGTD